MEGKRAPFFKGVSCTPVKNQRTLIWSGPIPAFKLKLGYFSEDFLRRNFVYKSGYNCIISSPAQSIYQSRPG